MRQGIQSPDNEFSVLGPEHVLMLRAGRWFGAMHDIIKTKLLFNYIF